MVGTRHATSTTITYRTCPWAVLMVLLCLTVVPVNAQSWELVWADEFDYTGLPDTTKWSYDVGASGWGNQEEQYYTASRLENARVENGALVIEARRESFQGSPYTSARLVSRGKGEWTYGRIEARAILPTGRGTWPAIWMLPTNYVYGNGSWPDNGEIDIMEHVGFDPEVVHGSIHVDRYNGLEGTHQTSTLHVPGSLSAYHVYTVEWSPDRLDFFVDDQLYFQYENEKRGWPSWPFDHPFHLILNIAVGGTWGGLQGIDDAIFPTQMLVDYVRVYENNALPTVQLTQPSEDVSLDPGASLTLSAEAAAGDTAVQQVSFYQGDGLLGTVSVAPFTLELTDLSAGCYAVHARVEDEDGWFSETLPREVTVGSGCPQAPYLMQPLALPGTLELEHYDLGGPNVAYRDLNATNEGAGFRQDEGVDLSLTGDGQTTSAYITGISSREWTEYTVTVAEAGTFRVEARVSSSGDGGAFALEFDGVDKTGSLSVPRTGSDSRWTTVRTGGVALDAGVQTMRFVVKSGGFNIDNLTFRQVSSTAREASTAETGIEIARYPNPFLDQTMLSFVLPEAMEVEVVVFNNLGQQVTALPKALLPPGTHQFRMGDASWAAGQYYARIHTKTRLQTIALTKLD